MFPSRALEVEYESNNAIVWTELTFRARRLRYQFQYAAHKSVVRY